MTLSEEEVLEKLNAVSTAKRVANMVCRHSTILSLSRPSFKVHCIINKTNPFLRYPLCSNPCRLTSSLLTYISAPLHSLCPLCPPFSSQNYPKAKIRVVCVMTSLANLIFSFLPSKFRSVYVVHTITCASNL